MTANTANTANNVEREYNLREKAWRANVAGVLETIAASASDQDVRRAVQDVVEQLKEDRIHVSIRQSMFTDTGLSLRPAWEPGDQVRDEWRGIEFEAAVYRVIKHARRSGMIPTW